MDDTPIGSPTKEEERASVVLRLHGLDDIAPLRFEGATWYDLPKSGGDGAVVDFLEVVRLARSWIVGDDPDKSIWRVGGLIAARHSEGMDRNWF